MAGTYPPVTQTAMTMPPHRTPAVATRRHFLKTAALAGTTAAWSPRLRAQGANSDVRVAVIGTGGQGSGHVGRLLKDTKGCRFVAACDADYNASERNKSAAAALDVNVQTYIDYRRLLENKDIDAVIIATPNHTHSLIGIAALRQANTSTSKNPSPTTSGKAANSPPPPPSSQTSSPCTACSGARPSAGPRSPNSSKIPKARSGN